LWMYGRESGSYPRGRVVGKPSKWLAAFTAW